VIIAEREVVSVARAMLRGEDAEGLAFRLAEQREFMGYHYAIDLYGRCKTAMADPPSPKEVEAARVLVHRHDTQAFLARTFAPVPEQAFDRALRVLDRHDDAELGKRFVPTTDASIRERQLYFLEQGKVQAKEMLSEQAAQPQQRRAHHHEQAHVECLER